MLFRSLASAFSPSLSPLSPSLPQPPPSTTSFIRFGTTTDNVYAVYRAKDGGSGPGMRSTASGKAIATAGAFVDPFLDGSLLTDISLIGISPLYFLRLLGPPQPRDITNVSLRTPLPFHLECLLLYLKSSSTGILQRQKIVGAAFFLYTPGTCCWVSL